jgi:hypothetical protein
LQSPNFPRRGDDPQSNQADMQPVIGGSRKCVTVCNLSGSEKMRNPRIVHVIVSAVILLAAGCATTQKPTLYPNAHLKNVGDAVAQRDIGECIQLAENSGVSKSNNQVAKSGAQGAAVGGAAAAVGTLIRGGSVLQGAAAGAAVGGTAGAVSGAFRNDTSPVYRNFVQRCLHDRGYDVIGWQ